MEITPTHENNGGAHAAKRRHAPRPPVAARLLFVFAQAGEH